MKTAAIVMLATLLALVSGVYIGTVRAYGYFSPAIEARVINDANAELLRVGVRKYELALDNGTVMVIRRR